MCYKDLFHSSASLLYTACRLRSWEVLGKQISNSEGHFKPAMSAKVVTNRFAVGRRENWSESGMDE